MGQILTQVSEGKSYKTLSASDPLYWLPRQLTWLVGKGPA